MRAVADANVVVSALIRPDGWSAHQFKRRDVEWFVPAEVAIELTEHEDEYVAKAGCTRPEWRRIVRNLLARLTVVSDDDLAEQMSDVVVEITKRVDRADVPYVAALLATAADVVWTRDRALQDAFPGLARLEVPRLAPALDLS